MSKVATMVGRTLMGRPIPGFLSHMEELFGSRLRAPPRMLFRGTAGPESHVAGVTPNWDKAFRPFSEELHHGTPSPLIARPYSVPLGNDRYLLASYKPNPNQLYYHQGQMPASGWDPTELWGHTFPGRPFYGARNSFLEKQRIPLNEGFRQTEFQDLVPFYETSLRPRTNKFLGWHIFDPHQGQMYQLSHPELTQLSGMFRSGQLLA
jgi:hypothetical protein